MTKEERTTKLKAYITCLKCQIKGHSCDDNCPTQYEAGNMGKIIENLEWIAETFKQEPCEDAVSRQAVLEQAYAYGNGLEPDGYYVNVKDIQALPPVTPNKSEIPTGSTTKNDLGADAISRADVNQVIEDYMDEQYHVLSDRTREHAFGARAVMARINELHPVILQEPILGKIKAEIEQRSYGIANDSVIQGMKYERAAILEILDRYKAELKAQKGEEK